MKTILKIIFLPVWFAGVAFVGLLQGFGIFTGKH